MASVDVAAKNIWLNFDRDIVLRDVQLDVLRGEKFVIVGPSGKGKSVLLKVLAGILNPSKGQVQICGEDIYAAPLHRQIALLKSMGMLFQKNALFDSMTCYENIAFPLREAGGFDNDEISAIATNFLSKVGLTEAKNLYPDEISGGMQKRLGIARALALKPKIIFYDDPTAGLDPITSRKIIDLVISMQKETESTVIAVTNDMNRAYQLADRIGFIFNGELIITGTPQQTKTHKDPRVRQFISGQTQGPLTEQL